MTPDARSESLRAATAAAEQPAAEAERLGGFLQLYYRDLATEDLVAQRPEDLLGAAMSHRDFAATREPGTALVRVLSPQPWSTGRGVVQIVTDDMRFLVDSLIAELHLQGRPIHLTAHPQLRVVRGEHGELGEISAATDTAAADAVPESWIQIFIGPEPDARAREELTERLHEVLADVRVAVADWRAMTARASEIATELATGPPASVPAREAAQGAALLAWLVDGEVDFLGYREYRLADPGPASSAVPDAALPADRAAGDPVPTGRDDADSDGAGPTDAVSSDEPDGPRVVLEPVPGTGLGLLREDRPGARPARPTVLTGRVAQKAGEPRLLIITKANSRSTVHRPLYLDYIGVKTFDDAGRVTGERRFLGLFTSSAYNTSVTQVPYVAATVQRAAAASGYPLGSHLERDLVEVLETYPRDELFATDVDRITEIAQAVVHLQERPRTRLFLRDDDYARYVSCLVYLPRDRYNTAVRHRMERLLLEAFDGASVEHSTRVSRSVLAMVHFVVRLPAGVPLPAVDLKALERRLVDATRTWEEDLADAARDELGEERGSRLVSLFRDAFPAAYKERFSARVAVADLVQLDGLEPGKVRLNLYQPVGGDAGERRLKVYLYEPVSLTAILPIFHHLGVEVTDQRPYELWRSDGTACRVLDFGLRAASDELWTHDPGVRDRFHDALDAVWRGVAESDQLGGLVLRAGLDWRQVSVLRAVGAYLQQSGWPYSRAYTEEALLAHAEIAASLVRLFEPQFDPDRFDGGADEERRAAEREGTDLLAEQLDAVTGLDPARLLRAFVDVIRATEIGRAHV